MPIHHSELEANILTCKYLILLFCHIFVFRTALSSLQIIRGRLQYARSDYSGYGKHLENTTILDISILVPHYGHSVCSSKGEGYWYEEDKEEDIRYQWTFRDDIKHLLFMENMFYVSPPCFDEEEWKSACRIPAFFFLGLLVVLS